MNITFGGGGPLSGPQGAGRDMHRTIVFGGVPPPGPQGVRRNMCREETNRGWGTTSRCLRCQKGHVPSPSPSDTHT